MHFKKWSIFLNYISDKRSMQFSNMVHLSTLYLNYKIPVTPDIKLGCSLQTFWPFCIFRLCVRVRVCMRACIYICSCMKLSARTYRLPWRWRLTLHVKMSASCSCWCCFICNEFRLASESCYANDVLHVGYFQYRNLSSRVVFKRNNWFTPKLHGMTRVQQLQSSINDNYLIWAAGLFGLGGLGRCQVWMRKHSNRECNLGELHLIDVTATAGYFWASELHLCTLDGHRQVCVKKESRRCSSLEIVSNAESEWIRCNFWIQLFISRGLPIYWTLWQAAENFSVTCCNAFSHVVIAITHIGFLLVVMYLFLFVNNFPECEFNFFSKTCGFSYILFLSLLVYY